VPGEHGSIDPVAAAEAEAAMLEIDWGEMFDLYPQQFDFCCGSTAFFQGWVGGRGTGKTFVGGGPKALHHALRNPGRLLPGGRMQYCPGALFGRTMDEAHDPIGTYFEAALDRFWEVTGIQLLAWYSAAAARYTLINGATVAKRSYGRDDTLKKKGRSPTYAWIGIDEPMFADVDSQTAVAILSATVRHPIAAEPVLYWMTSPDGYRGCVAHAMKGWVRGDPDFYLQTATVFDNPHVDDRFRRTLRAGCTDRQWQAEGLGHVLKPLRVIYSDYDERKHIVPWEWDRNLPWVLCVDWGQTWGWTGAIQVVTRDDYHNEASDKRYAAGTWVIAREWPMTDGSRPEQRRAILSALKELGFPRDAAADKAVPAENHWLETAVGPDCPVHTLKGDDTQRRDWGIGAVQYMLAPGEGKPPRLYFAESLEDDMDPKKGTIRAGMQSYQYRRFRTESGELMTSNRPEDNTPASHSCDALRYGITTTMWDDELHGGAILPYLEAHPVREDADAGRPRISASRNRPRRRRRR
jgi:hypothetical protein